MNPIQPGLEARWRLAALLHDAPEYVIGDMISPFKAVIGDAYKEVEARLLAAIHQRFGLPVQLSDDLVALMLAAADGANWSGPINATAPEPVTNAEFSRELGLGEFLFLGRGLDASDPRSVAAGMLADVYESIEELRYYRRTFLRAEADLPGS